MRAETWYYVADNDVFPETFINFLGFDEELTQIFLKAHGEVLTADWWRGIQERHSKNEVFEVLPYAAHRVRVASSLGARAAPALGERDLERLRQIQDLTNEGLNLEGVRRVLELQAMLYNLLKVWRT